MKAGRVTAGRRAGAVVAGTGVLLGSVLWHQAARVAAGAQGSGPGTQAIVKRDLTNDQTFDGVIGRSLSLPFITRTSGTVTAIAAENTALRPGDVVFRVDDTPVLFAEGSVPAWRDISWSSTSGPDIHQLEASLVSGGFDPDHLVTVDGTFDAGTYSAIARMQTERGLAVTGAVALGQIVFAPAGTSIGLHQVTVGATVSAGQTITETVGSALSAVVTVPADVKVQIHIGQPVAVTLPDYSTTTGTVNAIGTATDDTTGTTSVVGTIAVDRPRDGQPHGIVDQAPIRVRVTQVLAAAVTVVPAGAIEARIDGTYAVEVVADGGGTTTVTFVPGVSANGSVEVREGDLGPGAEVAIPARG